MVAAAAAAAVHIHLEFGALLIAVKCDVIVVRVGGRERFRRVSGPRNVDTVRRLLCRPQAR